MEELPESEGKRKKELQRIADGLAKVRTEKPETFHEALQLFWLYALHAGVINYGRLDDFLGPYLAADLDSGKLSEQEAYDYLKSLWTMIENRRTTVNGRVIVGGKGRKHPKEADRFMHIALKVCKDCRYVEPQFTFRRWLTVCAWMKRQQNDMYRSDVRNLSCGDRVRERRTSASIC